MQVQEIMTNNPICCTPDMDLQQVARMMAQHNCGALPVVDDAQSKHLVGIITDRDITCRAVAEGRSPFAGMASDCMTSPVFTASPEMSIEDCCKLMEEHQVRRAPVADGNGCCCGIISQADIALCAPEQETAILVKEISLPDASTETDPRKFRH